MATEKTTSETTAACVRADIAHDATAEIESLCGVLLRELQGVGPADLALRGMVLRVKALNSVAMSVLGADDDRDADEMHQAVRGVRMEVEA